MDQRQSRKRGWRDHLVSGVIILLTLALIAVGAFVAWPRDAAFFIEAETQTLSAEIRPVGGAPINADRIILKDALVCHGRPGRRGAGAPGPCGEGYAEGATLRKGALRLDAPVRAALTRRPSGEIVMTLEPLETGGAADKGECRRHRLASLLEDGRSEPRPLCDRLRVSLPVAQGRGAVWFAFNAVGLKLGRAISPGAAVETPALLGAEIRMLGRGLPEIIVDQFLHRSNWSIDMGADSAGFTQVLRSCSASDPCKISRNREVTASVAVAAGEGAALAVSATVVAEALEVGGFGQPGRIIRPAWYARLVGEPTVPWLLLGFISLLMRRWLGGFAGP